MSVEAPIVILSLNVEYLYRVSKSSGIIRANNNMQALMRDSKFKFCGKPRARNTAGSDRFWCLTARQTIAVAAIPKFFAGGNSRFLCEYFGTTHGIVGVIFTLKIRETSSGFSKRKCLVVEFFHKRKGNMKCLPVWIVSSVLTTQPLFCVDPIRKVTSHLLVMGYGLLNGLLFWDLCVLLYVPESDEPRSMRHRKETWNMDIQNWNTVTWIYINMLYIILIRKNQNS